MSGTPAISCVYCGADLTAPRGCNSCVGHTEHYSGSLRTAADGQVAFEPLGPSYAESESVSVGCAACGRALPTLLRPLGTAKTEEG